MIQIILSERDFDYELQALVNSFFPGQKSRVVIAGEAAAAKQDSDVLLCLEVCFGRESIRVAVISGESRHSGRAELPAGEDWHRHADKSAHPYRTRYKNELKRLVFCLLRDFPEQELPAALSRQIPVWGTMTGVRPTKIPMNGLLAGKTPKEVESSLRKWYCCSEEKLALCMEIAMREAALLQRDDLAGGYSLYVGIPFCPTTCLYCSFPSYPYRQFGQYAQVYLQALKKEITEAARQCRGRRLVSVYIGGGTPTTLTAEQLEELFIHLYDSFPMQERLEFTVEAGRPDSITEEKLRVLLRYGADRISINPQTMQQKTLELIGRKHTAKDTVQAFQLARSMGFHNINMDLIIGLPRETAQDFADTLEQIRALGPDSVTVHSLVIKRASGLRNILEESGDFFQEEKRRQEQMEQMFAMACVFAEEEGYQPYYMYRQKNSAGHFGSSGQENIGYAREGSECLYNILIMEEVQTIVAVGAGASTKVYDAEKKIVSRRENVKNIVDYINRIDEMIERKTGLFPDRNAVH
ncbi:MAG: coproporphyrinogen dehydrogenase HemZ [Clostridiaceae bacterium]|nr:coproporphyrinogen dehydrogenase HemZ [Clostridiaceae bacterium]